MAPVSHNPTPNRITQKQQLLSPPPSLHFRPQYLWQLVQEVVPSVASHGSFFRA